MTFHWYSSSFKQVNALAYYIGDCLRSLFLDIANTARLANEAICYHYTVVTNRNRSNISDGYTMHPSLTHSCAIVGKCIYVYLILHINNYFITA